MLSRLSASARKLQLTPIASRAIANTGEGAEIREFVDRFSRRHDYLRISLTERCNLRCQYCMPEDGVALSDADHLLSNSEVVAITRAMAECGVRRIRLTGGEPMVRRDLEALTAELKAVPGIESIAMTTNGMLLGRRAAGLRAAGMDTVNVSLDTLEAPRFELLTRRRGHERVLRGVDAALEAGFETVKMNCVVMKGVNEDELGAFVELTRTRPIDVRFIEFMPFDDNRWSHDRFVSMEAMLQRIRETHPTIAACNDDSPHATARTYRVPGYAGRAGFIASMSMPFCGGCNRLRLTADGNLKTCLFGSDELSLRDVLRAVDVEAGPAAVRAAVAAAVQGQLQTKHAALGGHGDMHGIKAGSNRPMILIGG